LVRIVLDHRVWKRIKYVVEFAEEARERDVAVVVQGGMAEDEDSVLFRKRSDYGQEWMGCEGDVNGCSGMEIMVRTQGGLD
jgi:hypothetical protein